MILAACRRPGTSLAPLPWSPERSPRPPLKGGEEAVTVLLQCWYSAVTVLLYCCYTAVILLLHCCYTVVSSFHRDFGDGPCQWSVSKSVCILLSRGLAISVSVMFIQSVSAVRSDGKCESVLLLPGATTDRKGTKTVKKSDNYPAPPLSSLGPTHTHTHTDTHTHIYTPLPGSSALFSWAHTLATSLASLFAIFAFTSRS
jgi:hypothetical protein